MIDLGVLNEMANQRVIKMAAEEKFSCKRDDPSQQQADR
jgi:hypothetical protein